MSVFRASSNANWQKSLDDLGLRSTPRWTDVRVADELESKLIATLGIAELGSESYLLDSRGRVIHSRMGHGTMIQALDDSIAALRAGR